MRPPTAGPTAVAMLNIVELSAMALVSIGRSTISSTKAWRAGALNAFTTPRRKASTTICQGATTRRKVRAESAKARSMLRICVTTMRLRRGTRSATAPPYRVKAQVATPDANPT